MMEKKSINPICVVLFTLFLMIGCNGEEGGGGLPLFNIDSTGPTAEINMENNSIIGTDQIIIVSFNESTNEASVLLGGSMGDEASAILSDSNSRAMNDTLTISPVSAWSEGADRLLSIDCKDLTGNSLDTLNLSYTVDGTAPILNESPADGATIGKTWEIVIEFNESIDINSLVLGGLLEPECDSGVWSQTTVSNDTLTISPSSTWSAGNGRTLIIDCSDLVGNSILTKELSYNVDITAPTATINDSDDILLNIDDNIVIFTKPMAKNTLNLSGSLLENGYDTAWSTASYENDTLTISPTDSWPIGPKELSIDCSDIYGNQFSRIDILYNVIK